MRCSEPDPAVYASINLKAREYRCKVTRICYQHDTADIVFQSLRNKNATYEIVVPLNEDRKVAPALLEELRRRHTLGMM